MFQLRAEYFIRQNKNITLMMNKAKLSTPSLLGKVVLDVEKIYIKKVILACVILF